MPIDQEIRRVDSPGQADRCQGVTKFGQCDFVAMSGQQWCKIHVGQSAAAAEKKAISNLRLVRYRARMEELVEHPDVKNIREEIGILRILLEEQFNACSNTTDLLLHSNKIADLVMRVEKLVSSCHRLEKSTGSLLDKSAAIQLAAQFVEIINAEVKDPETIARISDQLVKTIQEIQPKADES